jgi:hypothetical protein
MKKFIIVAFVVSLAFLPASLLAQTPPDSVTESGSFGNVTFSHKDHVATIGDCKQCHHQGESPVQKCEACHTADSKVAKKDAYHKNCTECHKSKGKGPTGCMDCHKK